MSHTKSVFDDFTNLYSLSKTLRFELKPVGKTLNHLPDVVVTDAHIKKLYTEVMKPALDSLHSDFITETLKNNVSLDLQKLEALRQKISEKMILKDRASMDRIDGEIEEMLADLRSDLVQGYNETAKAWKAKYSYIKLKEDGHHILTEAACAKILQDSGKIAPDQAKVFEKFWTYFTGYNQNRDNYYVADSKDTAVANRAINENLVRHITNLLTYDSYKGDLGSRVGVADFQILTLGDKILDQHSIDAYNEKIGTINSQLNEQYPKQKDRLLRTLHKQIGSNIIKEKRVYEITKDREWDMLHEMVTHQTLKAQVSRVIAHIKSAITSADTDFMGIYLNNRAINTISSRWFTSWDALGSLLAQDKITKIDKDTGTYKMPKQLAFSDIHAALARSTGPLYRSHYYESRVITENQNPWDAFIAIYSHELDCVMNHIGQASQLAERITQGAYDKKKHIVDIKTICDAYLGADRIIKYFQPKDHGVRVDAAFYTPIDLYLAESRCQKYYDAFRNYITRKPNDENKIKLNFANGQLLEGWDANKEDQYFGVLLEIEGRPHLAVTRKGHAKFFDEKHHVTLYANGPNMMTKYIYKLLPGPNKMLPKVAFAKSNRERFAKIFAKYPSIEMIREEESFKKQEGKDANGKKTKYVNRTELNIWINFMKAILSEYDDWRVFDFGTKLRATETYTDVSDFYRDVSKHGYKLDTMPINHEVLMQGVEMGEVYLFTITNKDLSRTKDTKGKDNLHTSLFRELLKPANTLHLKLSGGAEIFIRPHVSDLGTKKDNAGKTIVDHKRYAQDKYLLHFPIEVRGGSLEGKFNDKVNKELIAAHRDEVNVIGIDRGEKHLLYFSVVSPQGVILEQGSLNTINGQSYHEKLSDKQDKRNAARENWEEIGNIKNFKEGYLSQAIHEIYTRVLKYDAIIAIEDLNFGFRLKRQSKVEKAVYTKFEIALAKKLNHLIFKDRAVGEKGGVLHPYQLTPLLTAENQSIYEKSRQWGVILKVSPAYTSARDPVTSWYKHKILQVSPHDSRDEIRSAFGHIAIERVGENYHFSYEHEGQLWHVDATPQTARYTFDRTDKKMKVRNVHADLHRLLRLYKGIDISAQIKDVLDGDFWKSLAYCLRYLTQIRNTDDHGVDYIQSPVADAAGTYFDSRIGYTQVSGDESAASLKGQTLPVSGDGNGAYHIALKGQNLVRKIVSNPTKSDLKS